MAKPIQMADLNLKDKTVLIREDFNVPIKEGKITSDARVRAALPTIKLALQKGAKVILISHLGQPEEGQFDPEFSLAPVALCLEKLLGQKVIFEKDLFNAKPKSGEIILCENVRFNKGEKKNNDDLAKKMADLCDVFVMDAFASAHRAQASTHGVAKFAKVACAGPLLVAELDALERALENPEHPVLAITAGSKVSTKLQLLENLMTKVDQLIVGGGIANTFMAAAGLPVGKSLIEADFIPQAKNLLELAKKRGAEIPIPTDVVVAKELSKDAIATVKAAKDVAADEMILDIGPETCKRLAAIIQQAKTIIWNGPVGVFEYEQFAAGTKAIAEAIANSRAFSIAGGGDTLSAIGKFGVTDKLSYISTGGGAFLEFLQGDKLPAVAILEERAK